MGRLRAGVWVWVWVGVGVGARYGYPKFRRTRSPVWCQIRHLWLPQQRLWRFIKPSYTLYKSFRVSWCHQVLAAQLLEVSESFTSETKFIKILHENEIMILSIFGSGESVYSRTPTGQPPCRYRYRIWHTASTCCHWAIPSHLKLRHRIYGGLIVQANCISVNVQPSPIVQTNNETATIPAYYVWWNKHHACL